MRKSAFPEVEGEAIGGAQWIDLDKIYPAVGLEASEIHRRDTGYLKYPKFHMRKAGAPAVLFARACAKVFSQKSKAKHFEGPTG